MQGELETFCRERRSLFYPKADLPLADDLLRPASPGTDHSATVAELCREVLGARPASVRPLGEAGTFHLLYRAVLPGEKAVIVRLNALSHLRRDYLLYLDPWVAGLLRAAGLPALEVYGIDVSRRFCPFDFEILQEAPGRPLKAFDDDEERLQPLLFQLGRFLARLHAIRTRGFGFPDVSPLIAGEGQGDAVGECPCWTDYVLRRLDDHLAQCTAMGAIEANRARRIEAVFAGAQDVFAEVRPSLLHGDPGSHNVFTDGSAITALIDWEDCLSGDPVFDVAFWATFHPDRRHPAFLAGYRAERALPDDFERRFWLYFLRVALSKTVLRRRLGVRDRPGRPPAAQRIHTALARLEGQSQAPRAA